MHRAALQAGIDSPMVPASQLPDAAKPHAVMSLLCAVAGTVYLIYLRQVPMQKWHFRIRPASGAV